VLTVEGQGATFSFRSANTADVAALRRLLVSEKLPSDDVSLERQEFLVAVSAGQLVGCGALERFGSAALLRSLAVSPEYRGKGAGAQLYERLVVRAKELGLARLFLLTTTAAPYFSRRGFQVVDRASAPEPMTRSAQFANLCPSTATCMSLAL
jgi:amino-acid N-acetyltransferase